MRTSTFTRSALAMAVAAAAAMPIAAQAQSTPWLVRVRAVNLDSANGDTTGMNLSINNKVLPEVDFSYFFSPQVAAELILTVPQSQSLRAGGVEIATLKHLPPTLTAQYHFTDFGDFKPYVGAGLNLTLFSDVNFNAATVAALHPSIDSNSVGLAVQVGFDYQIAKGTYLNFDIKKVQIKTDVKSSGTKVGEFKIDPTLVGVGIGWKF